jgi:RND family efflux transporter MFP subunit
MSDSLQNNNIVSGSDQLPKKTAGQRLLAILIILVLLGVGIAAAMFIVKTKPQAKRRKPVGKMQTLVSVIKVAPESTRVQVKGYGTVIPSKTVNIQARVSGTVTTLHPEFIPGGLVGKGDTLVRLDDTDYRLVLKQKQNILAQRQADLRLEEGNQEVARKEWELVTNFTDMADTATRDIVLREPQLAKAKANISSAATDVEKAQIDLDRTVIKAPFDGIVSSKNIDIGSQVSPQSSIGTLIDIDSFWAEVSVSTDKLQWFILPEGPRKGPEVTVSTNDTTYEGQVIKLLPELEQNGLMARLLVEIKDPYGRNNKKPPLLLGSFVQVAIQGKNITDVYKIPRLALKDRNKVFIATENNTLHIQPVSVLWTDTDFVFIDKGLERNTRIVVTNIPTPIEGMDLKIDEVVKNHFPEEQSNEIN